jgi:two-component system, sensor histidine kinase and response regulator
VLREVVDDAEHAATGAVPGERAVGEKPAAMAHATSGDEPGAANGLMDWSRLDELAEYDTPERTVVRGAVASHAEQGPACLDEIRRSIGGRDVTQLRAAAHKLKGAASNLGAVALAGCASRIEAAAKNGDVDAVEPLLGNLVVALEASLRDLRRYADAAAPQDGA